MWIMISVSEPRYFDVHLVHIHAFASQCIRIKTDDKILEREGTSKLVTTLSKIGFLDASDKTLPSFPGFSVARTSNKISFVPYPCLHDY